MVNYYRILLLRVGSIVSKSNFFVRYMLQNICYICQHWKVFEQPLMSIWLNKKRRSPMYRGPPFPLYLFFSYYYHSYRRLSCPAIPDQASNQSME